MDKKQNISESKYQVIFVSMVFILYFIFVSGFIPQIIGGTYPTMQLNNTGSADEFYVHDAEIKSSAWLFKNRDNNERIFADSRASRKLWFSNNDNSDKIIKNVFPSVIDNNAYVYSGYTNTLSNIAFVFVKGETISYNFPSEFLSQNKNTIYNNGGSKIFK